MDDVAKSASAKIAQRLIPYLALCYFISYLDRVNLSFAAITFRKDLAITSEVFGFGAGIFFAGYFLFEVPSNILLERVGARRWIARIMITWGLVSASMALVNGTTSFYIVRFMLGVAEAGFFPGIILYLTYWYTSAERARIVGLFMLAVPLSSAVGAPVSSLILDTMGGVAGLAGWQWLFILEALPAIVLGIVTWFYLEDGPLEARWLTADERTLVLRRLAADAAAREAVRKFNLADALCHPRVIGLALVYFGIVTGLYGFGFWAPQIVKAFGLSIRDTGFVVAIPYVAGALAMIPWARHSDATGERVWHVALPAMAGGIGLIVGAYLQSPFLAMIALTIGSIGTFAALPVFWTLPTALLTGTAAAGGIALINAIGNVGGFVGPYLVGWIRETTGNNALSIATLGLFMIAAGAFCVSLGHDRRLEEGVAARA
jgi:ACS family tartrate transporter-like MFS transporter